MPDWSIPDMPQPLTVLLHGDPRLLAPPLWSNWQLDPTVALGVFGLAAAYAVLTSSIRRGPERPVTAGQRTAFFAGCFALLLALGPPIEDWASLLLAGHMFQHVLLTMLAPPLLLLGTPAWLLRPVLRWPLAASAGYALTRPLVALVLSSAAFMVWHVPALYEASLQSQPVHVVQHLSFIATAVLAWWPLVGPLPEWPRPAPPVQCLYLFGLTLAGSIVGSFLALADTGLYPSYQGLPRMWGLDLIRDQQIAGLMMGVGANAIYLLLTAVVFLRWANQEDAKERAPRPTRSTPIG